LALPLPAVQLVPVPVWVVAVVLPLACHWLRKPAHWLASSGGATGLGLVCDRRRRCLAPSGCVGPTICQVACGNARTRSVRLDRHVRCETRQDGSRIGSCAPRFEPPSAAPTAPPRTASKAVAGLRPSVAPRLTGRALLLPPMAAVTPRCPGFGCDCRCSRWHWWSRRYGCHFGQGS
jgi:hypothetical protein